jgi:hypothetical protein
MRFSSDARSEADSSYNLSTGLSKLSLLQALLFMCGVTLTEEALSRYGVL